MDIAIHGVSLLFMIFSTGGFMWFARFYEGSWWYGRELVIHVKIGLWDTVMRVLLGFLTGGVVIPLIFPKKPIRVLSIKLIKPS